MGNVIVGMTLSLDGYISDREGRLDRLYPDLEALPGLDPLKESIQKTGAVVIGRNAFDMAEDPDWYAGNYEYQAPMFVLTHRPPRKHPRETEAMTFTFVSDGIQSAIRQARAAAGDRDVTVIGGASTFRQCLQAGLADCVHIDIMPVLLGEGPRLFEGVDLSWVQLERTAAIALPGGRTHLAFRVVR